ncbi:hypothetical protein [Pseudalkalibacillus berkeleyi]|uniref:YesK-like protein n=1 Tax=Pseudalkalibacillus berkeleyi TaxID=1069813 RepID=A0ABS9H645_9BACL|nr:hypothetical protein [Pseudalkalibacillus berkeleyi]MCF6139265.1 hypothetical protein [Pseudalkalibacillus berkeleyi]
MIKKYFGLFSLIIVCFVIGYFITYWVTYSSEVLAMRLVTILGLGVALTLAILSKNGWVKTLSISLIVIFGVPYFIIIEFGRIFIKYF